MSTIFNYSLTAEQDFELRGSVDRDKQIRECINSILAHEKISIIGKRGIGKSFLLLSIRKEILEKHKTILPNYINFSSGFLSKNNDTNSFVLIMLEKLIYYIWVDILGNEITLLYSYEDGKIAKTKLENKIVQLYKLTHTLAEKHEINKQYQLKATFFVNGGTEREQNKSYTLSTLTRGEFVNLFIELCDDLKNHLTIDTIVFLCDEANHLSEHIQNEIEVELINVLPSLPYSFVYVRSILSERMSNETKYSFDRIVYLYGFDTYEITKTMIENRITDRNKLIIDDEAYSIVHDATEGSPRNSLNIISNLVEEKSRNLSDVNPCISISSFDAALACNYFFKSIIYNQREMW